MQPSPPTDEAQRRRAWRIQGLLMVVLSAVVVGAAGYLLVLADGSHSNFSPIATVLGLAAIAGLAAYAALTSVAVAIVGRTPARVLQVHAAVVVAGVAVGTVWR